VLRLHRILLTSLSCSSTATLAATETCKSSFSLRFRTKCTESAAPMDQEGQDPLRQCELRSAEMDRGCRFSACCGLLCAPLLQVTAIDRMRAWVEKRRTICIYLARTHRRRRALELNLERSGEAEDEHRIDQDNPRPGHGCAPAAHNHG